MSAENSSAGGIGITLGGAIAVICSWSVNHSIGWAIVHLFCGWFYVIYYLIEYAKVFQ